MKDRQRIKTRKHGRVRCKRGKWVRSSGRYYTCHVSREEAGKSEILTKDDTGLSVTIWKKG